LKIAAINGCFIKSSYLANYQQARLFPGQYPMLKTCSPNVLAQEVVLA
jgi:hypothetical protein